MKEGGDMKIRLELDSSLTEDELVIRSSSLDEKTYQLKDDIEKALNKTKLVLLYKNHRSYYLDLDEILFFETYGGQVQAHTAKQLYQVSYRLYELEEGLPDYFIRISKSTIVNIYHIEAIKRNIRSSSLIEFRTSHTSTYVSRFYYRELKKKIEEIRFL